MNLLSLSISLKPLRFSSDCYCGPYFLDAPQAFSRRAFEETPIGMLHYLPGAITTVDRAIKRAV